MVLKCPGGCWSQINSLSTITRETWVSVAGIGGRDLVVNGICYVLIKIFA